MSKDKEPELICECGHDHLQGWHVGMPPMRIMNKCPECTKCQEFNPTKESSLIYLKFHKAEKEKELKQIIKSIKELEG